MTAVPPRPARRPVAAGLHRDLLRLLNTPPWAGGIERWSIEPPVVPRRPPAAVIAIPARDEHRRIGTCLDACVRSIGLSGAAVSLLVLVNGSRDGTADQVRRRAARYRCAVTLVEVDFAPHLAHAGAARRLALELAGLGVPADTALLTTDADACPLPGWVGANLAHLDAGAALVCGRILPDPVEAALLPRRLDGFGALEGRYHEVTRELGHLLDPDPHNPWPHHGAAAGASLGTRAGHLRTVGGVPLVPSGEDRLLASRVRAAGLVVRHADDVRVEVSCRTRGRASGGMADTIRYRMEHADPLCDDSIEPAVATYERIAERARLRVAWPDPVARAAALAASGTGRADVRRLARTDAFELAWDRYEALVLMPVRERVRLADLSWELDALRSLLAVARRAPSTAPGRVDPAAPPATAPVTSAERVS